MSEGLSSAPLNNITPARAHTKLQQCKCRGHYESHCFAIERKNKLTPKMKVVLLVVRCMIPARKLLHAQTVPKAVLIFRCITTLQKNTKIVSTHVKMASGVIPVPQSLVKDALKMLKYFA